MFGMSNASEFTILLMLLPLVPAILIFLMFPKSSVAAQGPLQGLSIRAGGAFGGYLIILLVLISWISFSGITKATRTWTVYANVYVKDDKGRLIDPSSLDPNGLAVSYEPTYLEKGADNDHFRVVIKATENSGVIPRMTVTYAGVGNAYINLTDPGTKLRFGRDDIHNIYTIDTPLEIKRTVLTGLGDDSTPPSALAAEPTSRPH
jgi:hypothetical protein